MNKLLPVKKYMRLYTKIFYSCDQNTNVNKMAVQRTNNNTKRKKIKTLWTKIGSYKFFMMSSHRRRAIDICRSNEMKNYIFLINDSAKKIIDLKKSTNLFLHIIITQKHVVLKLFIHS